MEFKNFAFGSVASAPSPDTSGTSLTLQSGEGAKFPSVYPFNIVIWPSGDIPSSSNAEIATVTGKSSDVLTIVRAKEGTSARAVVNGDNVMFAPTAEMMRRFEGHWTILQSANTLNNASTSAQNAFSSGQDEFAAEANSLYYVELSLDIRTGTTSHSTGLLLGGTATFNWVKTYDDGYKGGVGATVTANNSLTRAAATNIVETPANATANSTIKLRGLLRVTNAGTIIPKVQFSAGPGGTCEVQVGSYCLIKKLGIDTTNVVGDWS